MNNNLKVFATAILVAASASMAYAETAIGFCTETVTRTNKFRLGGTEKQGAVIRLNDEKLAVLKGQKIIGINAAFGTRYTNDDKVTCFLATAPDAAPLASVTTEIASAASWNEFTFDTPYTITGNEGELYLGYYSDLSTEAQFIMSDFTADAKNCCYAYCNGEWVDTYGLGFGNLSIRARIAEDVAFSDLMIKPVNTDGYFLAGKDYKLSTQVFNVGTEPIKSFDVNITIQGEDPVKREFKDLDIAQNKALDIELPDFVSLQEGYKMVKVELTNVNVSGTDVPSDGIFSGDVFCYPAGMERTLLLEGFTGQECSNCPAGHGRIEEFIPGAPLPVIEVMHHSGYFPDFFTMDEDMDFTFFYGGAGYAPAFVMNRTTVPSIGTVPVMQTSTYNLEASAEYAANQHPYVSISLETSYNKDTRQLDVTFRSLTHKDLPEAVHSFNVFFYQNGLSAYQKPYSSYTHNKVYRGSLTGNAWGIEIPADACKRGGRVEWTKSMTLPEEIFSDYWEGQITEEQRPIYTWAVNPDDMYLVACFGALGNTPDSCPIYNAVEVKLGESHSQGGWSGIESIVADDVNKGPEISVVNGKIIVGGDYDSLTVCTLDGRTVSASTLLPGIYVIRATSDNNTSVKKVIVR